ncbi:MAG: pyruvate kinase alpha/beta domain-containing protein [Candidatus Lokiarchaeota archaeon]
MGDLKLESTYFEKAGPINTEKALEIAKYYSKKFEIKDLVIASTTGSTAEKMLDYFSPEEYNLTIVTHSFYFTGSKNRTEFPKEKMDTLRTKGLNILTGTHAMSGIERNIRNSMNQWCFVDLMAKYIREQFSQGTKVCIEMASMVADAGYINSIDDDIICIAGTGRGADTVCLIKPAPTSLFDKLRVKAILAKPL